MFRIPRSFYLQPDVVSIGRQLIGKFLVTRINGRLCAGMIVETEAYAGPEDRASHACGNRRTRRTEIMFRRGGVAYVFLCYGMHHLFNVVTNREGIPHAVLIRAVEPVEGLETMLARRRRKSLDNSLTSGPAALTEALGIKVKHTGADLLGNTIWIEDRGVRFSPASIGSSPRIGVEYAGKDARRPWRFFLRNSRWISRR